MQCPAYGLLIVSLGSRIVHRACGVVDVCTTSSNSCTSSQKSVFTPSMRSVQSVIDALKVRILVVSGIKTYPDALSSMAWHGCEPGVHVIRVL